MPAVHHVLRGMRLATARRSSLKGFSMATGQYLSGPLKLANPNDVAAPTGSAPSEAGAHRRLVKR
jgi:hypothetical protein